MKVQLPEPPPARWDTDFEPYAMALGFLLREYNEVQGLFAVLFDFLIDGNPGASRAAWYSIKSDRQQRNMIMDAAVYLYPTTGDHLADGIKVENTKIVSTIRYAIGLADNLAERRDASAHTPVSMVLGDPIVFQSNVFRGSPLAASLKGKSLLKEFALYRDRALVLRDYVQAILNHLRDKTRFSFPEKPAWPEHPDEKPKANPPRSAPPKQSVRPAQPSPASHPNRGGTRPGKRERAERAK